MPMPTDPDRPHRSASTAPSCSSGTAWSASGSWRRSPTAGSPRSGTAVVVLCEEPRPAYDRVQLTSYFSGPHARGPLPRRAGLHGRARHRAARRRPGGDRRPRGADRHRALRGRPSPTTRWCWPPARTPSCRRSPARTPRAASSTAPSRTCSPSRSTRRTRDDRRGRRRRAARPGGGGRAAGPRTRPRTSWSSRRG